MVIVIDSSSASSNEIVSSSQADEPFTRVEEPLFAATVINSGPSNNNPEEPCSALVSTVPSNFSCFLPETSTKPPSPEFCPPFAETLPLNDVFLSDQTMTFPPSPSITASALISTSLEISVFSAV